MRGGARAGDEACRKKYCLCQIYNVECYMKEILARCECSKTICLHQTWTTDAV